MWIFDFCCNICRCYYRLSKNVISLRLCPVILFSIMASILAASGFKHLESLKDFSDRFPNVPTCLDSELEKIWICHKNPENIPKGEEIDALPFEDYYNLSVKVKKKITAGKHFYTLLTEFSAVVIFDKIYCQFKNQLTTYLFTKCYLFYNWGINAFEPVIDHFVVHSKIQKGQNKPFPEKRRLARYNSFTQRKGTENAGLKYEARGREKSVDLFEEPLNLSKGTVSKPVSFKSVLESCNKAEKFYDILKNSKNPYQEVFSLKKVLYNIKLRSHWPGGHVLSKNNVEDLIKFIVQIPVVADVPIELKLLGECKNWMVLTELLSRFLKNHERINKNDGYGRILKKHLKSVETPNGRRLFPIPKTSVCSYVLDILRKVLPIEVFGRNCVRKSFFSGLIKVINGSKDENFIWYSLLRVLLIHKSDLTWTGEIGDNYSQMQVILKLFKFVVIHYVFIILRNYFYVTETGSSGFGLRYYRKSDMESASSACLNSLLQNGHIRVLSKKDFEGATVERNWLNTGKITEDDLKRKLKRTMNADSEYKQPIARVRFLPKSDFSDELRIITNVINKSSKSLKLNSRSKKLEKHFLGRLSRRKKNLFFAKLFLEFLVDKIGFGFRPLPCNPKLEAGWKKAVHLKEKYGKLFFVKADISEAFDSVNYSILTEILRGAFEKEAELGKIQLMKIIEWRRINGRTQKAARFSFSNRPRENAVMINRSVFLHHNKEMRHYLDLKFLEIIKQVVMQQKIEIKGRVFRLTKGLAQGSAGRFSPQLCEIYYSSLDNLFFGEFIDSNDSIFLRGVDDYLFVTSDVEQATRFLALVQNGFADYNVRFNNLKLRSNLVEDIEEISYLGLIFNFKDMSVKPNYSKYQRGGFLSTINLLDKWGNNHFNKQIFLQRRSLRLKCLKLHPIVFNGIYNNLKTIRRTIFEACLTQSLRVLTLADYLYSGTVKNDLAIYQTLLISCSKIKNLVTSCEVSKDEVNWLFFFALLNILRKYSGQFKLLLLITRFRLQKCERVFAKSEADLLFNFLKDDILDEDYWKKLKGVFKELGNTPQTKHNFK